MTLTRDRARTLGVVVAALAVVAAWLWYGPAIAGHLAGDGAGAWSEAIFTIVMFGPLLAGALGGAAVSNMAACQLGAMPGRTGGQGVAIGLGGVLLAISYAAIAGTVHSGAVGGFSLAIISGLAIVALQVAAEETLFRGWLQPLLARVTGTPLAIGIISIAFAVLHLLAGAHDAVALLNLALGGVLFGVLASRSGGIAGAFAAHFAWNAAEQLVLGLDPNPGIGAFGAIFDLDLTGALRWGGSGDGLNASWAMSIALCAILVPLVMRGHATPRRDQKSLNPSLRRPI